MTEVKAPWVPDFFWGSRCPDWQAIPLWLISDKALGGLGLSEARGMAFGHGGHVFLLFRGEPLEEGNMDMG